ncbi:MAG TPA: MerR family transcriptional regulator [Actinopolymorphaceae bacterium]|nr:MerR family transcriptional regulator [Actinopolymorphaceae bacterium]
MSESNGNLSIGQVSERTGLSVHTLRFYEREGILANPVRRAPGGQRVYTEDDVEWLTLCIILRASGMPLPAIRRYTELVQQGAGNEGERLALLREHQQQVTVQLDQLHRCLDLITFKVGVYEDILSGAATRCEAAPAGDEHEQPNGQQATTCQQVVTPRS